MSLPRGVAEALVRFGIPADTLAWIDDQHHLLGAGVIDVVGETLDGGRVLPQALTVADLAHVRGTLGERYLQRHHPGWCAGVPSPGFWRDRDLGGGSGLVVPLGNLEEGQLPRVAAAATQRDQPPPRGLVLLSRQTHVGNHPGSFAFYLVPADIREAVALGHAVGRQHTVPGSIGQTSGRTAENVALVWEVQPNLLRPSGNRNRGAARAWRRHRSWPVATAAAALIWLAGHDYRIYVLRGEALRATHEVDPLQPLSDAIAALHDRTFATAAAALGFSLEPPAGEDADVLLGLAKLGLSDLLRAEGLGAALQRVRGGVGVGAH